MSIATYLKPENGPAGRAFSAWLDHAPEGLASRFVLLWFVILYTAFGVLASGALGLQRELLETYALGQHPAAGYTGYPPLAPLIAGAWFRLFPPTDWAFHLLAMLTAAVGLFAADRIARLYLTGDKQITALLLLLLTPFYQFMGQGFGAGGTALATWPLATWCFLRALSTRDLGWSAAAGGAAALAVLGHYASVFLIAGFAVAVLTHPARAAFLRSWAPWLMAAVGLLVLAPHLQWLYATDLKAAGEAVSPLAGDAADALRYGLVPVAAAAVLLALWWIAVRPDGAALRDALWPSDPDGRTLIIVMAVPVALTLLAAAFGAPLMTSLINSWPGAATWFLLPVVLLRPRAIALTRTAAIRIAALTAAVTFAAVAAAPWLASNPLAAGTQQGREHDRQISAEVTKAWRLATGLPLRIVTGDAGLTSAVAFYSPDHPEAAAFAPGGVAPARLAADGFAALCRAEDDACVAAAKRETAGNANTQYITFSTINRHLGKPGTLGRFLFILAPPESKPSIILR